MVVAVWAFVFAHAMDIISTVVVMALVPGSAESNPLFRDPITFKFMLVPALEIKSLSVLAFYVPLSAILYMATRSWGIASLVFWSAVPSLLNVAFKNWVILLLWGSL